MMISARKLVVVIVLAQMICLAANKLCSAVENGFLIPLWGMIGGRLPDIHIGLFNVGLILNTLFGLIFDITVFVFLFGVILRFGWKWIDRLLPKDFRLGETDSKEN